MITPPSPRRLWDEFKAFAFKGNLIDLAVAVVLGAAFGDVIKAVVSDLIMPLVTLAQGKGAGRYEAIMLGPFPVGHLIGALLNFIIIASAVFLVIVKLLGTVMKAASHRAPEGAPTTRECPRCLSVISIKATKCAYCTADIEVAPEPVAALTTEVPYK
jgi:large conductance mechanosensitive channel